MPAPCLLDVPQSASPALPAVRRSEACACAWSWAGGSNQASVTAVQSNFEKAFLASRHTLGAYARMASGLCSLVGAPRHLLGSRQCQHCRLLHATSRLVLDW